MSPFPRAAHGKAAQNWSAYRAFCKRSGLNWAAERRRAVLMVCGLFAVPIVLAVAAANLHANYPTVSCMLFILVGVWCTGGVALYLLLDELRTRRIRAEVAAPQAAE